MQCHPRQHSILTRSLSLFATLLCLSSFAIHASASTRVSRLASDQVDRYVYRYDMLTLDPSLVARNAKASGIITIDTGLERYDIELAENDLRAPGYRAQEILPDGSTREVEMGEVTTYAGRVLGREGQTARFTIGERGISGMIIDADEKLFLEPLQNFSLAGGPTDYVFYRESDVRPLDEPQSCGATAAERFADAAEGLTRGATATTADGATYTAEIATDADNEYVSAFGSAANANNEILTIMNQVDGVYENELGISFQVVLQNSYAGSDPYSGVTDPNSLLNEFRTVWGSQMTGVARDVAHLFTGRDLDGSVIGIAWIGVVCNNPAYAYGLSQRYGTSVQRYCLTAHELGHNFNACHSNTSCNPNTSTCTGTIMNSVIGSTLSFCQFSRDQISTHVATFGSCLATTSAPAPPPPSDPPPAGPSNLTASPMSSAQINVAWADNSSNENGFKIERKIGTGSWATIMTTGANVTGYTDGNLSAGTTYTYRVKATNNVGDSNYSNEAGATTMSSAPAAPTNASVSTVSDTQLSLVWSDNSSNETGFKVVRKTGTSGSWSVVATTGANVTSLADSGLSATTLYVYRVRSTNGSGDSSYSNETSAYTAAAPAPAPPPPPPSDLPADPSDLSASPTSRTSVDIAWSDNSSNENGFKIERSENGRSWSQIATVGAGATSYSDDGLRRNKTYSYRVRAYNGSGNSGYSNVASARPSKTFRRR
jgi:hypothetical protein